MSENTTTSVLSIKDTVLLALTEVGVSPAGYESVVDKAVTKLTEREQALTAALIEAAESEYGYGDRAEAILSEAGLAITPEPEEEAVAEEEAAVPDADTRLARIEALVEKLVAAAGRAGLTL